jgi:hypothetical protein
MKDGALNSGARTVANVVLPFSNLDGEKFHTLITFAEAAPESIEMLSRGSNPGPADNAAY